MMKKDMIHPLRFLALCSVCCAICAVTLTACSGDDDAYSLEYFYEKYGNTGGDTPEVVIPDTLSLAIAWDGTTATITGETDSVTITRGANESDVIITSTSNRFMEVTLSGQTTDGSLLVYSLKPWGLVLNDVYINNADGPAINNQCGKWLYVTLPEGTNNTLTDGTVWADAPMDAQGNAIDQKGTFFSEGQMDFNGSGTLVVNGNARNGIASDDYAVFNEGNVTINIAATGANGLKVNDGLTILGGTLTIDVKSAGGRGVKNDARTTISGGTTTITTSGACKIETVDGVKDTTSCAGIKCDSLFTMTAGQLTITSTGDGGKGINCADSIQFQGGMLLVNATGGEKQGKPKGVKSDKEIVVSGGSFEVHSKKSKACDSGGEEAPVVMGSPTTLKLDKRDVIIKYE
jgi:hypothetical protein